jgi:hypothetical protein
VQQEPQPAAHGAGSDNGNFLHGGLFIPKVENSKNIARYFDQNK